MRLKGEYTISMFAYTFFYVHQIFNEEKVWTVANSLGLSGIGYLQHSWKQEKSEASFQLQTVVSVVQPLLAQPNARDINWVRPSKRCRICRKLLVPSSALKTKVSLTSTIHSLRWHSSTTMLCYSRWTEMPWRCICFTIPRLTLFCPTILVTSPHVGTRGCASLNQVKATRWDVYNNGRLVVHGLEDFSDSIVQTLGYPQYEWMWKTDIYLSLVCERT